MKLGKTQRTLGLLCTALRVMSYRLQMFCLLMTLPHYVLLTIHIISVKMY